MTNFNWTDDNVKKTIAWWREGVSSSQIALRLGAGCTRNAVIGKLHRIGESGSAPTKIIERKFREGREARARPSKPSMPFVEKAKEPNQKRENRVLTLEQLKALRDPKPPQPMPEPIAAPLPPINDGKPIFVTQLRDGMCKYAIGTTKKGAHHFCGHPTDDPGKPWCEFHRRKCYQPISAYNYRYSPLIRRSA